MMKNVLWLSVCLFALHCTVAVPKWDKKFVEAEQVALEASGFIVPPPALVQKIMRDLKTIRSQHHEVDGIMNRQKWIPGELLARGITEDQIMQLEKSEYGPIENVRTFSFGSLLVFNRPYHAEVLSQRIMKKFMIRTEPNTSTGDKSQGMVRYDQVKRTYTIEKGPEGYSYPGYRNRHMWKFTVTDGVAKLKSSAKPGMIRGSEEMEN